MITLSRRQIGDADRVGGIELMILWPKRLPGDLNDLGPEPVMELDHEREATVAEKAMAERLVRPACDAHGLVPVHVRVCRLQRPPGIPEAHQERTHLAVTIILGIRALKLVASSARGDDEDEDDE